MCGIVGTWGRTEPQLVEKMKKRLVHRGPDAHGTTSVGSSTLGHRRLSIMDPQGGDQPIFNEDGSLAIVANGEIYNFHALKADLEQRHTFITTSDSEVPLHLYEEIGVETAAQLDGMFAFVLTDGDHVYAARDTVGIKPLYYGYADGMMVFGSELKALAGFATDVAEFPPGYFYHSATGFTEFKPIPHEQPIYEWSEVEMCAAIRSTLEQAVVKRLMSDVPLGAFLSGGLDSSIIAAIAAKHMPELHTFSIGLEGSSDLLAARKVSEHIGSIHHEHIMTFDEMTRELPSILYHMESYDADLVPSGVPCYLISRVAAQHVKVILTGEGADELFGGYTYHKKFASDMTLHEELYRSVKALHDINLQRVDRLTMANSIEGRVPFLDLDLIRVAQQVPPEYMIRPNQNGKRVEKYILRKACEDLLPHEIVWRDKEQFDEGSGSASILNQVVFAFMSPEESDAYRSKTSTRLRSHEEATYHMLLADAFDGDPVVMNNVARWADRPNHAAEVFQSS